MDFLIALFGGLYLLVRYSCEKGRQEWEEKEKKRARDAYLAFVDAYPFDDSLAWKIRSDLRDFTKLESLFYLVYSNLMSIATRSGREDYVLNQYTCPYLYGLVSAKMGQIVPQLYKIELSQDRRVREEQIELARQVQMLMAEAGRPVEYWFKNEDRQKSVGTIRVHTVVEMLVIRKYDETIGGRIAPAELYTSILR